MDLKSYIAQFPESRIFFTSLGIFSIMKAGMGILSLVIGMPLIYAALMETKIAYMVDYIPYIFAFQTCIEIYFGVLFIRYAKELEYQSISESAGTRSAPSCSGRKKFQVPAPEKNPFIDNEGYVRFKTSHGWVRFKPSLKRGRT